MIIAFRRPERHGDPVAIVGQAGLLNAASNTTRAVEITLPTNSIQQNSANGTVVGTAGIVGPYTGTPSWSLTEPLGIFQINSSTGVITVLDNTNMTVAAHPVVSITIAVSGTVPAVPNLITAIKVTT